MQSHQVPLTPHGNSALYEQGRQAFYRELPNLLKTHAGQWVAFRGDCLLGCSDSQTELYQRCLQDGLDKAEFVILFADRAALTDAQEIDLPLDR